MLCSLIINKFCTLTFEKFYGNIISQAPILSSLRICFAFIFYKSPALKICFDKNIWQYLVNSTVTDMHILKPDLTLIHEISLWWYQNSANFSHFHFLYTIKLCTFDVTQCTMYYSTMLYYI